MEALWKTEDWWTVWLGLRLVLLALAVSLAGGSIRAGAVTPGTWCHLVKLPVCFRSSLRAEYYIKTIQLAPSLE